MIHIPSNTITGKHMYSIKAIQLAQNRNYTQVSLFQNDSEHPLRYTTINANTTNVDIWHIVYDWTLDLTLTEDTANSIRYFLRNARDTLCPRGNPHSSFKVSHVSPI
jgi:hypothetical protein